MQKENEGFTLIEMLIVAAMLAVISLAIYSMFSNSVRIWQRIHASAAAEDMGIFFEKFTSDIRNAMDFKTIGFSGEEDSLKFAVPVYSAKMSKNILGEAIYAFDPYNGKVKRAQRDYSQAYLAEGGFERELLTGVKKFRISYYAYDVEKKEYIWQDEWHEQGLPLAVRIVTEIGDDNGQIRVFTRTITIPAGNYF